MQCICNVYVDWTKLLFLQVSWKVSSQAHSPISANMDLAGEDDSHFITRHSNAHFQPSVHGYDMNIKCPGLSPSGD